MYAGFKSFPLSVIYKREWKKLMSFEKKIGQSFDWNVFVSENEVELFNSFCPDTSAVSIPNGVDFEYYQLSPSGQSNQFRPLTVPDRKNEPNQLNRYNEHNGSNRLNGINRQNGYNWPSGPNRPNRLNGLNRRNGANILFMGAMDYFPNEDAVLYFSAEIWPYVKKQLPDAHFYIVGGNPSKKVRILSDKDRNIIVTGHVPDVRPYLKITDVFVAPLRIARGVQNKVLDAMASGVPVVARPEAVQGISSNNGPEKPIFVEENNMRFASSVIKLIKIPHKRHAAINASKKFVKQHHNWEGNLRKLEEIMIQV
jgi:glycosyltransferase involved in cell wall biosynthesis